MHRLHDAPGFLDAVLEACAESWGTTGPGVDVSIGFSTRMTSSLGRCYPASRRIHLASWLADADPRLLAEVLCHELAHQVVHDRHGRRARPHGREWRALMRAAGFEPRTRMPLPQGVSLPRRRARRRLPRPWVHSCPICLAERRAARPMRQWRCAVCVEQGRPGTLQIERRQA